MGNSPNLSGTPRAWHAMQVDFNRRKDNFLRQVEKLPKWSIVQSSTRWKNRVIYLHFFALTLKPTDVPTTYRNRTFRHLMGVYFSYLLKNKVLVLETTTSTNRYPCQFGLYSHIPGLSLYQSRLVYMHMS